MYAQEKIAGRWPRSAAASGWRACLARLDFVSRGFEYQDAELAQARGKLREKAQAGDPRAKGELTRIKDRQKALAARREACAGGPATRAGTDRCRRGHVPRPRPGRADRRPEDRKRYDAEVEAIAVKVAWAFEEAAGAVVKDVSKPHLARAAGLEDNPGFDLLSIAPTEGSAASRSRGGPGSATWS